MTLPAPDQVAELQAARDHFQRERPGPDHPDVESLGLTMAEYLALRTYSRRVPLAPEGGPELIR